MLVITWLIPRNSPNSCQSVFYKAQGSQPWGELWCEESLGGLESAALAPTPPIQHPPSMDTVPDKDRWDLALPFTALNAGDLS